MAFEILYDALHVTERTDIVTVLKNAAGQAITSGDVYLIVENTDVKIKGTYTNSKWVFDMGNANLAKGRYIYYYELEDEKLNFPSALYID